MIRNLLLAITILTGFIGISSVSHAETTYNSQLNCTLIKYANSEYPDSWAKGWLPPHQFHQIIRDKGATYANYKSHWTPVRGNVTTDLPNRIDWNYITQERNKRGDRFKTKWVFSYFPHNKKFAARVTFTGYQAILTVWGTCIEIKNNSPKPSKTKSSTTKSSTTKSKKANSGNSPTTQLVAVPINTNHWNLIRTSNTTKIFYHKHENALMIASKFELSDKLRQRLEKNEKIQLFFGHKWDDDIITPLVDDFTLWKPAHVQFGQLDNLDAIIIRSVGVKAILQNKKPYLYVWLQADKNGAWAWRRTTVK